jgi:TATA-binding protein-associated factor Taf7
MIDNKNDKQDKENKALKKKVKELEKELQRKEKALAEAAALLILKNKQGAAHFSVVKKLNYSELSGFR